MHILENPSIQLDGSLADHAYGYHVASDVGRPAVLPLRLCVRRGDGGVHGRRWVHGEVGRMASNIFVNDLVRVHGLVLSVLVRFLVCVLLRFLGFGFVLGLARRPLPSIPVKGVDTGVAARVLTASDALFSEENGQ